MRILYDYQIFSRQRHGGVSRYFFELANELTRFSGISTEIAVSHTNNEYFRGSTAKRSAYQSIGSNASRNLLTSTRTALARVHTLRTVTDTCKRYVNRRTSVRALEKQHYDIFHPTGNDPYFLEHLNGKPFVCTLHDMTHELFPESFYDPQTAATQKALVARAASRIITVSENTKRDVVRLLGVSPDIIDVVYHGNSIDPTKQQEVRIPGPYLLFVGGRSGYKNFSRFIQAIHVVLRSKNLFVICAGGETFTHQEVQEFERLGVREYVIQVPVNDHELAYLYAHAICFVFPSLYEGFGIPIVEAFACSCPVALSNTSCFPEIAGDAAMYFNPYDLDAISAAVQNLIEDAGVQSQLMARGIKRLCNFSWENTCEQTLVTYRKVLVHRT